MNIEIRHLQLVQAITEEGTVTAAAERLNVTQSALSHQLREVEDRLGTPLFLRVNRRLSLAPAGERLLDSARRVLDDLRRAEEDIGRLATHQEGVLRVSTACYTCYQWLPPLLAPFHKRFPRVDVEIVPEATRRTIEALHDRTIDFALVHEVRRDPRLRIEPLFEDEMVVITAADHELAANPFITPADLDGESVILMSPADESSFAKLLLREGGRPRKLWHVQLTEAIVELVRAGVGVSAVPRWVVARELKRGDLAAVRFTKKGLWRKWSAATLRAAETPAPIATLIELIRGVKLGR